MLARFLFLPLLIALTGAAPGIAYAQAAGARGDDFLYKIMPNDTLTALAGRFTSGAGNWGRLQALNAVQDPTKLAIGREIKIPFSMIPERPASALVTHVSGQASVDGRALRTKDQVPEGKTVRTGANGFATLQLDDGSLLSIPPESTLEIMRLRVFKGAGLTDSVISMKQGSVESTVAPKETGVGRFEVRTPLSITGVRGTRLRVHASSRGAQSEVLKGVAHITSEQAQNATLHQDQGTAIDAQGKLLGIRPLLPPPNLPASTGKSGRQSMRFPAVAAASSYLVRVSSDKAGADLVSSQSFDKPDITFGAPGPGTYYVAVRAIDSLGIGGRDAQRAFLGASVLHSSDGAPILAGDGSYVLLTDY